MLDGFEKELFNELWSDVGTQISINNKQREELWLANYQRLEAMPKDKLIRMIIGDRPC